MLSKIRGILRLTLLEEEISYLPIPGARLLSRVFSFAATWALMAMMVLGAILASPVLFVLAVIRLGDVDTSTTIRISARSERKSRRAVVVVPNWDKCGSTEVFHSQIGGLSAQGFEVDLIIASFPFVRSRREQTQATEEVIKKAHNILPTEHVSRVMVVHRRSSWQRMAYLVWRRGRSRFVLSSTEYSYLHRAKEAVSKFCEGAEVVVCNRVTLMDLLSKVTTPIYLESHDIVHQMQNLFTPDAAASDVEFELGIARRASIVGCFTDEDEAFYRRSGTPVMRSRFSVRAPSSIVLSADTRPPTRLLFVGDANYQNLAGLKAVLPGLPSDMTLLIAGRVGDLLRYENFIIPPNVKLLGFVPSLAGVVAECDVLVFPDFYGTGISVKMLEGFGWGKPSFLTERAARGLDDMLHALPPSAIAPNDPALFFPTLRERLDHGLADEDWLRIRDAAQTHYSTDVASDWALAMSAMLGGRTSTTHQR